MKIAFVLDDTLDSTDGVQQYVLLLSQWMIEQGHEVHYLVGETRRTDLENIHSLTKNIRVRFNKNRLSVPLPADQVKIRQILGQEQFDVLHVQMPYSPLLSARIIANAPASIAMVGTFHIAPHSKTVALTTKALGRLVRSSLARVDRVVSVSPVAKEFARTTFGIDSQVIPNAIDSKKWKRSSNVVLPRRRQLVFLGRLVARKGCVYFLKACKELYDEGLLASIDVVIAGDGPDRKKLKKYARDNRLNSSVKFVGFVSESEKRRLLQHAYLGVFPSTGGESFGIVLLEAMAAGSIAVAGNNPGYMSVVGRASEAVVDPHNIGQFTDTLRRFITDDKLYTTVRAEQAKLVASYDVKTVGGDILKLYEAAIQDRKLKIK